MKKYRWLIIVLLAGVLTGCGNPIKEGMEAMESGQYGEAITAFETITKTEDKDKKIMADAYRGIAMAYWEMEAFELCRDNYKKALEYGTEETATLYNFLSICEIKLGNDESALAYLEQGIVLGEQGSELLQQMEFNQISVYESLKDWENAKIKMQQYIAKYPDDEIAAKEADFLETR